MDPEQRMAQLEDRIEELQETVEENNKLLRSIQRSLRWSFWGRLLIWIIVLALPFIVLGPLLRTIVPGLSGTQNGSVFGLPSATQIQTLVNQYKSGNSSGAKAP